MNIISSSLHFILKSIGCDKIIFLQYFVKFGFLSHDIFLLLIYWCKSISYNKKFIFITNIIYKSCQMVYLFIIVLYFVYDITRIILTI
jgi:hypothetical protein